MVAGPSARSCTIRVLSGMRSLVAIVNADGPLTARAIGSAAGGGVGWTYVLDGPLLIGFVGLAGGGGAGLACLPRTRAARASRCRSSASLVCRTFSAARVAPTAENGTDSRAFAVPRGSRLPRV